MPFLIPPTPPLPTFGVVPPEPGGLFRYLEDLGKQVTASFQFNLQRLGSFFVTPTPFQLPSFFQYPQFPTRMDATRISLRALAPPRRGDVNFLGGPLNV